MTRASADSAVNFLGFPKSKIESLRNMKLGDVVEKVMSLKGHNWGKVSVNGSNMVFSVGGAPAFVFPLADVLQTQHGRDEVTIQMPVDDTVVDRNDDALAGMTFYVPKECEDFGTETAKQEDGTDVGIPASKKLFDIVKSFTMDDLGAGDVIASFDSVGVVNPRGRFDVEMYSSTLHLMGQATDFRVQYQNILRIFVVPKANSSQTLVAIALDPPIRKGQTTYSIVLCQFPDNEEMTIELQMSEEALAARNEKGAKLMKTMTGPSPDVFARTLRGLSGSKLTRTGAFRDSHGESPAVRCSYKNDDGHLYPLERAFFYVLKPPMVIPYDDIRSIEFMRQTTGITAAKTFDLLVSMKSKLDDARDQTHLFRGIPRSEWTNLFEWIQAKGLRVENLKEVERGPSAAPAYDGVIGQLAGIDDDSEEDYDMDEEDEDFDIASESESDGDASDVSDENAVETVPEGQEEKKKKRKKRAAPDADGGKKKRKKKDKNAPKKNMSAFMFYSNSMREKVKEDNPGIAFTDVAKKIGEMWKELTAEDKAPFEAQAEADKERYSKEMGEYEAKKKAEGGDADTVKVEEQGEDSGFSDEDIKKEEVI